MYTFDSRVRYSETDENGKLAPLALMNYLQDCSLFQSEALGVGLQRLKEKKRAWLLSGWQIVIESYPKFAEPIRIGTIPYSFKGGLGHRNFAIWDADGNFLVKANSRWMFVDTEKGTLVRPDEEEKAAYGEEAPLEMEYAPRRMRMPEGLEAQEVIEVREHHLDTNHHVNNAQYVAMALELLPAGETVREIRAEYHAQAHLGDQVIPYIGWEGDWFYVGLASAPGQYYATVALRTEITKDTH